MLIEVILLNKTNTTQELSSYFLLRKKSKVTPLQWLIIEYVS